MIIAIVTGTCGTLQESLKRVERSVRRARECLGLRREETAVYGPRWIFTDEGPAFLQYRVAKWNLPVWSVWRREPDAIFGDAELEERSKVVRPGRGRRCAGCVHVRRSYARNGFGWWEEEGGQDGSGIF